MKCEWSPEDIELGMWVIYKTPGTFDVKEAITRIYILGKVHMYVKKTSVNEFCFTAIADGLTSGSCSLDRFLEQLKDYRPLRLSEKIEAVKYVDKFDRRNSYKTKGGAP